MSFQFWGSVELWATAAALPENTGIDEELTDGIVGL
jgi:hypothetical protein